MVLPVLLTSSQTSIMDYLGFTEILLVAFVVILIPGIFYLVTLQKALAAVSPQNRKMPPGQVWLLLIPLFNIVWYFIVVDAIAVSFERESISKGMSSEPKPTYNIGLATAILNICSVIPVLGFFCGLATIVCGIVHWVKVNETKNDLQRLAYYDGDTRPTIF